VSELIVGIFVGGRGSRMGGVAKGLLKAPDSEQTLVERLLGELRSALPQAPIVLVGEAGAYAGLGLRAVNDEPAGVGPLGGLLGLLGSAADSRARWALALTCDLPRVDRALLSRLAAEAPEAAALITAQAGVRNPLVARYTVAEALPAARSALHAGSRSVQAVLDRLTGEVVSLRLSAAEEASLMDWDVPQDLPH
jgi:molybdopterin-guanine dinucleotide biosynthesis protein A